MEFKMADHIHMRMSLAVQVIDDFTNRVVTGQQVQVRILGEPKPIRKADGYYIFLNLKERKTRLKITASQFLDYEESVDIDAMNPLEPVIKARLKPNRCYSLPQGTTCVEGKASPGTTLRLVCPDSTGYYRLMADYPGGEEREINIFHPAQMEMEGKSFCIRNKEKKQGEDFMVSRVVDSACGRYQLAEHLKHAYQKVSARIYPILLMEADANGEFFAPLTFLEKEHTKVSIRIPGEKKERECELEYGTVNQIL